VYEEEEAKEEQKHDCESRREWSDWGACSTTCGGGIQTRTASALSVLSAVGKRRRLRKQQQQQQHHTPVYHTPVYHTTYNPTVPTVTVHSKVPPTVHHTYEEHWVYHSGMGPPGAALAGTHAGSGYGEGYEDETPEGSGYEDETPEDSGYEDETLKDSGYEDETPKDSGYEDETPKDSGSKTAVESGYDDEECKPITEKQMCNTQDCPNEVVGYDDDTTSAPQTETPPPTPPIPPTPPAVEIGYGKKHSGHRHHQKNMWAAKAKEAAPVVSHKKTVPVVKQKVIHVHRKHIAHYGGTPHKNKNKNTYQHPLVYHPAPSASSGRLFNSDGSMERDSSSSKPRNAMRNGVSDSGASRSSSSSVKGLAAAAAFVAVGVVAMAIGVLKSRNSKGSSAENEAPITPTGTISEL